MKNFLLALAVIGGPVDAAHWRFQQPQPSSIGLLFLQRQPASIGDIIDQAVQLSEKAPEPQPLAPMGHGEGNGIPEPTAAPAMKIEPQPLVPLGHSTHDQLKPLGHQREWVTASFDKKLGFDVLKKKSISSGESKECICELGYFWQEDITKCVEQGEWGFECGGFPKEHHKTVCQDGLVCRNHEKDADASDATCLPCREEDGCLKGKERQEKTCLKDFVLEGEACSTVQVTVRSTGKAQVKEHATGEATETREAKGEATSSATVAATATKEAEKTATAKVGDTSTASITKTVGGKEQTFTGSGDEMAEASATAKATATADATASAEASVSDTYENKVTSEATASNWGVGEVKEEGKAESEACVTIDEMRSAMELPEGTRLRAVTASKLISAGDEKAFNKAYKQALFKAKDDGKLNALQAAQAEAAGKAVERAKLQAEAKAREKAAWKAEEGASDKAEEAVETAARKKAVEKANGEATKKAETAAEDAAEVKAQNKAADAASDAAMVKAKAAANDEAQEDAQSKYVAARKEAGDDVPEEGDEGDAKDEGEEKLTKVEKVEEDMTVKVEDMNDKIEEMQDKMEKAVEKKDKKLEDLNGKLDRRNEKIDKLKEENEKLRQQLEEEKTTTLDNLGGSGSQKTAEVPREGPTTPPPQPVKMGGKGPPMP